MVLESDTFFEVVFGKQQLGVATLLRVAETPQLFKEKAVSMSDYYNPCPICSGQLLVQRVRAGRIGFSLTLFFLND